MSNSEDVSVSQSHGYQFVNSAPGPFARHCWRFSFPNCRAGRLASVRSLHAQFCADRMSAVSILLNLTKSLSNGVWRRRSTRGICLPFFNDGRRRQSRACLNRRQRPRSLAPLALYPGVETNPVPLGVRAEQITWNGVGSVELPTSTGCIRSSGRKVVLRAGSLEKE